MSSELWALLLIEGFFSRNEYSMRPAIISKGIDEALKDKLLALHPENNDLHSMIKYMALSFNFGEDEKREDKFFHEILI